MCMWCRKWYIELLSASWFHKDDGLGHGNIYLGYIMVALELELPGGRLNKKDGLTRYGNSHVKDKAS